MKKDIQNREDIAVLVDKFYEKVMQSESLKPYFEALDWEHHLPIMRGFWEFIIFSTPGAYTGNVMNPHFTINETHKIAEAQFTAWLALFNQTIDELFEGPNAESAKNSAFGIGATMKYKLKKINE